MTPYVLKVMKSADIIVVLQVKTTVQYKKPQGPCKDGGVVARKLGPGLLPERPAFVSHGKP